MWFKSSWFLLHTALFITSNVVLGTPNEVASEQYDKTLPGLGVAYRANRRAQPWSNETISASLSAHEPTPVESTLVDSSTSLTSVNNPQTPHSRPEPSQANGATTVTADQSSSFASVSSATDVVSGTQASSRHSSGPSSSSSSTSTQHDVASSQIPSPSSRMSTVLPSQTKGSQTTTAFSTYGGTTLGLGSSNAATSTPESQLVSDVSSTLQVSQSSSSVVERQSSSTATTHRSSISEPTPSSSMAPEPSSATEQTPDSSFHQASTVTLEATSDNVASSITTNNGNSVGSTSPTSLAASNTMHQTGWSSAKTSLSSFGVPSSSGYAPGSTGPQSDTAFPTSTVSATSTDSPDHSHTSWNAPSGISTTSISSSVIGQSSGRSSSSISLTIPSTLSQISSGFIATTLYSGSSPLTSNVLSVTVVFSVTINSITISTAESLTSFVNTGSQLPPQSQNPVPSSFFIPVSETLAVPPSVATSLTSLLTGISLPGMTSGTGQPSQPSDESTIISAQSSLRTTPPSQSSQVVPTTTPSASNSTTSSTTEILSSQGSVSSDSTLGFSPSDSTTLLDGTSTAGSSTATVLLPSTGGTAATGVSETSLVSTQGSQPIPTSETLLLSTTLPTGLPLKSSLIISDAPGLSTGNSISSLASVTFPIGTGATVTQLASSSTLGSGLPSGDPASTLTSGFTPSESGVTVIATTSSLLNVTPDTAGGSNSPSQPPFPTSSSPNSGASSALTTISSTDEFTLSSSSEGSTALSTTLLTISSGSPSKTIATSATSSKGSNTQQPVSSSTTGAAAAGGNTTPTPLTKTQTAGIAVGGTTCLLIALVAGGFVLRRYHSKSGDKDEAKHRSGQSVYPEVAYLYDPAVPRSDDDAEAGGAVPTMSGGAFGYATVPRNSPSHTPQSSNGSIPQNPFREGIIPSPESSPRSNGYEGPVSDARGDYAQLAITPVPFIPAARDYPQLSPYDHRQSIFGSVANRSSRGSRASKSYSDPFADPFEHDLPLNVDARSETPDSILVVAPPPTPRPNRMHTRLRPESTCSNHLSRSALSQSTSTRDISPNHTRGGRYTPDPFAATNPVTAYSPALTATSRYTPDPFAPTNSPAMTSMETSPVSVLPHTATPPPVHLGWDNIKVDSIPAPLNLNLTPASPAAMQRPLRKQAPPTSAGQMLLSGQGLPLAGKRKEPGSSSTAAAGAAQRVDRGLGLEVPSMSGTYEGQRSQDPRVYKKRSSELLFARPELIGRRF